MSVTMAVYKIFDLIMLLMLIRIFLTWIPNVNWGIQPFKFLNEVTDVFFAPFRKLMPPVGMLDLSPIVAFIVLRLVQLALCKVLAAIGL